jgi:hypothetical protein
LITTINNDEDDFVRAGGALDTQQMTTIGDNKGYLTTMANEVLLTQEFAEKK